METLKHLYGEQGDDGKLYKISKLYATVDLQNTLKLLIRCNKAYVMKRNLLVFYGELAKYIDARETVKKNLDELIHNRDPDYDKRKEKAQELE